MGRTLSDTLKETQKYGLITKPYVKVELTDRWGGIARLRWSALYSGSETDYFHAACFAGDGSLNRLRVASPGGTLYRSRVTSPDPDSDYSQWTDWTVTAYAVAITAHGSEVLAFRIGTNGHIYRCDSSDNGASWGSWADGGDIIGTAADFRVAACHKDNGDAIVLYSNGTTLYRRRRLSESWEAAAEWTNSLQSISGVSVMHEGDWNVLITGIRATDIDGIWTCIFGDGYSQSAGTWSALEDLIERGATEPYEYTAPSLSFPDVIRCFFVERFTQAEAEYRLYWSHSLASAEYVSNLWREPVPFNLTAQYGLAMTYKSPYVWLTSANKVYRASYSPASEEITNDVLEIDFRQYPHKRRGYCKIVLDNTNGKYNTFDKLGWQVEISPGYHTNRTNGGGTGWDGKGNEWSPGPTFWVTDYKFISPPWYPLRMIFPPGVQGTLVLYTEDPWKMLKRWKARRPYSWAVGEKNLFQMLAFLFARIGLEFSTLSYSSAMVNFEPEFTMKRGYSAYWAVKKILSWCPDQLFFRGCYGYTKNPTADEAVYDTFHTTLGNTNLVFRGKYGTSAWEVNRAQVWGDTLRVERQNWDQIDKVFDRLSRVTTPDYPNTTRATERALAELRTSEIETGADTWVHVPTHCGLEPYDVIQITDLIAGISDIKRRVLGIRWYFNRKHYHYHQFLDLGAP